MKLSGHLLLLCGLLSAEVAALSQEKTALSAGLSSPGPAAADTAFSSHPSISQTQHCFQGNFASYDSAMAMLQQKNQDKPLKARLMLRFALDEDDFDRYRSNLDCQSFVYQVNGVAVRGMMIQPKQPSTGPMPGSKPVSAPVQRPVIIYNRGGNGGFGSLTMMHAIKQLMPLAEQGYLVIASNYRGEHNWGAGLTAGMSKSNIGQDEFGGADVADIQALVPIIRQTPGADANKIAMLGVSRGGMMAYLAARNMPELKTIIVWAGPTDLLTDLDVRPEMERVYQARIPDYAKHKTAALQQRSVLHFLDEFPSHLPVLLLHGDADDRVHVSNAHKMAAAMKARQQPHKLVVYPGDDHGLRANRDEAYAEIFSWLKQQLSSG